MPRSIGRMGEGEKEPLEVRHCPNGKANTMAAGLPVEYKDHFTRQAPQYSRYRPSYPLELFEYLASLVYPRSMAWDCATGGGQASLGLVDHFDRVIATDASTNQIAHAARHPGIVYAVSPAEESGIKTGSVDLVVVAQALHWFDFERFYREVRRVLQTSGAIAVWCYGLMRITPDVDAVIDGFYNHTVGPYWPPERRYIEGAYRSIPFPFEEPVHTPQFSMRAAWDLDHLIGYLGTWSSVQEYRKKEGNDPIGLVAESLLKAWGPPSSPREVRWPLHLRVGVVAR